LEFVIENDDFRGRKGMKSASDKLPPAPDMFSNPKRNSMNNTIEMGMNAPAPALKQNRRPSNSRTSTARNTVDRRSVPKSVEEIEITGSRKGARKAAGPSNVKYVNTARRGKSSARSFTWTWSKFGWMVCIALFARLILMEGGVVDFYSMEDAILEQEHKLELIKEDNALVVTEIHKIRTSPTYQRKITREHLGVIAKDEYLILFAKDSALSTF